MPAQIPTHNDDDFATVATRTIPPDPGIMKAIGLNHGFESAIADLVDNSIDARAHHVLVRFVLHGGLVDRLLVVDDGCGMGDGDIDSAMQLGRAKSHSAGMLGHFGIGMKSATFSQASVLTVLSRKRGCAAQGRRMIREPTGAGFECDVLDERQVQSALSAAWPGFTTRHGTIIRWDTIRTFPKSTDQAVTNAFIETRQSELRHHLGLIFHRLLETAQISIAIDVFDADTRQSGFVFTVEPIDPFAYGRSGAGGYPKTLTVRFRRHSIPMECHIWPAGSDSQFFRLAGAPVERYQGFYLYRNDRLISAGQWGGVTQENKRRKLARAKIDISNYLDGFTMSAEKSGVHMVADLVHAIEEAQSSDGVGFHDYLATAEEVFHESNKRNAERMPILPPGKGIAPPVRRALAREIAFVRGEDPIDIRWTRLPGDELVEVDRAQRTLWLNTKYRAAVLRGGHGRANDAPLHKALLFLLYEDIFHGTNLGARDKSKLRLWGATLAAAAAAEAEDFDG